MIVLLSDLKNNHQQELLFTQLLYLTHIVSLFDQADRCVDFMTDLVNRRIFLIISTTFNEIIPLIHDLPQLNAIYIFHSEDMKNNTELRWLPKYHKFKRIFTEVNFLCDRIQQGINGTSFYDEILISFHDGELTLGSIEENSQNGLNAMLMYSSLLKDILVNMECGRKMI